jgi:predicted nucleic acid-binding Zn finger protein
MTGKILIDAKSPKTQSIDAIKALLAWRGRAADPLPQYVELGVGESRVVLVLSNKKDAYYTVTARDCSCPAAIYNHGKACKHQRKHFPEQQTAKPATIKQPNAGRWHGQNGPWIEDEARPAKAAAFSLSEDL